LAASFALALAASAPASASTNSSPQASAASYISKSYAKRVTRRYINRTYAVALGPYFLGCQRLAYNKVRCEVEFKAGLYWRAGRVSVRNSGGYDYIRAYLPING